ncbi:MAG: tyrosine-protein phosphatase [Novosphingobium sp.]
MAWTTRLALTICLAMPLQPALADAAKAPAQASAGQRENRFVLVDGGRNFRDVGGYATSDGRHLRWDRLFRSGSLGSLTDGGRSTVGALNAAAIIDLRSTAERAGDRGDWLKAQNGYWTRDYELGFGNLSKALSDPANAKPEIVRTMMAEGYRQAIDEQSASYRELFLRLASGRGPVIVNCTAGKDRTGVAAALVLRSVGVPYAKVREDFLLSNSAPGMDSLHKAMAGQAARAGMSMSPEVMALLAGVDGSYLDAAFDQIDRKYGSLNGYLTQRLGLTKAQVAAVRRNLTR